MMSDETLFDRPFVGYDGSKNCHHLVTVFSKMHPKFQSSTFAFVYNPLKNFIPVTARGPGIQKQIRQRTDGLKNINIRILQKQQGSNKNTNQYLLDQFYKNKSTFVMLGFYGSKGEKVRSIDLSSRISQFIYDSKFTVAIIKRQEQNKQAVLYCCDGSEISYEGLKKVFIFCKKFGYELTILHTFNEQTKSFSKQVKSELKTLTDQHKNIKIQVCIQKGDLIQCIKSRSERYDWIITTKNGYRGQISKKIFIGSNTTQILTKINSNIIIL